MGKFYMLFTLLLIINTTIEGQHLSGLVLHDGEPVPGAVVIIEELKIHALTDLNGNYEFRQLPDSLLTLSVQMVGYRKFTQKLNPSDQNRLDIALQLDVLNLEGVVVTAERGEVFRRETAVAVSTIKPAAFEASQAVSLNEGLAFSPGLRVENNCQNCGFTQLRMNGLDGPYTQILINGRPVFSALVGVYGLEMIPAEMIDRIEVVRGGGSSLYGGNAIAGTINVITKTPLENYAELGFNTSLINGEALDQTGHFSSAWVSKDLETSVSIFGAGRLREHWDANSDGFSEITQLNNKTLGFDLSHNPGRHLFKAGGFFINEYRRGGNGFDLEPHQTDLAEELTHNMGSLNLSYEFVSPNNFHRYSVYAAGQLTERDSYYGGGGRVLQPGDSLTQSDITAINAYGNSNDEVFIGGLQYGFEKFNWFSLVSGVEFQQNEVSDRMPGYNRAIDQRVRTTGTYAQLSFKPSSKWDIILGGRYDAVHISGSNNQGPFNLSDNKFLPVFVPRLNLMYRINKDIKLRGSYAQGYRAPQAFNEDLHIETVGGAARFVTLSPDLVAERSESMTLSLNYSKSRNRDQMELLVEGFYTTLQNPFVFSDARELENGTSIITKRNGGGAVVAGVNVEWSYALENRWVFQLGGTVQRAAYAEEEVLWSDPNSESASVATDRFLRAPEIYGYYSLGYNPTPRWSVNLSGVYTGAMQVQRLADVETERLEIRKTPLFFEQNIRTSYKVKLGNSVATFHAGVRNFLNSYQDDFDRGPLRDAGYVYGPATPISLFAGADIKFGK